MIAYTGLLTMMRDFLGVPLGASYKSAASPDKKDQISNPKNIELIASILSITKDDVCIGSNPFYYKTETDPKPGDKLKLDSILKQLNDISKWVAVDLLADGYSVYQLDVKNNKVLLYPVLDDVTFVLNDEKEIVATVDEKVLEDALIFIHYEKSSLLEIEGQPRFFEVTPKPIQLSNISQSVTEMTLIEKSLLRYRRDICRVVRFVSVEVGASQGDKQQDVLDNVSSGVNANSLSLEGMAADLFDDEIPVFPVRKSVGLPVLGESAPTADIANIADLDHTMSKLFLGMKFPKSYADFSAALDATAVSMIRGDIRYSRMLKSARTLIERTIEEFLAPTTLVKKYKVVFKLQEVPNPEDEEVISALNGYTDFLESAHTYIFAEGTTKKEATYKLDTFVSMLGDSANLASIEKWVNSTRDFIDIYFEQLETAQEEVTNDEGDEYPDEEYPADDLGDEDVIEGAEGPEVDTEAEAPEGRTYEPNEKPSFE